MMAAGLRPPSIRGGRRDTAAGLRRGSLARMRIEKASLTGSTDGAAATPDMASPVGDDGRRPS